jgi:hypothetical protein
MTDVGDLTSTFDLADSEDKSGNIDFFTFKMKRL